MRMEPCGEVLRVTDVKLPLRILKHVDPEHISKKMAPERGLEPLTRRLTAGCSTIELLWNPNLSPAPRRLIPTRRDSTIELLWNPNLSPGVRPGNPDPPGHNSVRLDVS